MLRGSDRLEALMVEPRTEGDVGVEAVVLPPFRLVLHNDEVNTMDHVAESLVLCVPEVSAEAAWSIMLEAHDRGRAVVLVCPLERAELYAERLGGRGITASVEADG